MPVEEGQAPPLPVVGDLLERLELLRREQQEMFGELAASERRYRGLAKAVWKVQEEERRRLGRDLHDDLGQTLTALKIRLELLRRRLLAAAGPEAAPEPVAAVAAGLGEAIDIAAGAVEKTRRLSHLLRPQMLDDLGLGPALEFLARSLREGTGFDVRLERSGLEPRPSADLETLAYRIVQEALNNALKHSGAAGARVLAQGGEGRLRLTVRDEGRGFEPATAADAGGFGLSSLRDRVSLFHGRFRVLSSPGAGTAVEADLPLVTGEA